jgi:hypothetical protein
MSKTPATGLQHGQIDCDGKAGWSRRSFFKAGAFSFLGMNILDLLTSPALAGGSDVAKCDSVILVWQAGGPSHIDTFDPKPGQVTNGPYKAIDTTATGIQVCEHMPTIARNMKHASLIRSLTSKEGAHERATYEMHTGYKPLGSIAHPSLGSNIVNQKGKRNEEIPAYVSMGGATFGAGFLGTQFAPFYIGNVDNPSQNLVLADGITDDRFRRRIDMLRGIDKEFHNQKRDDVVDEYGTFYRDAIKMMYSKSLSAFSLKGEKESVLRDYGVTDINKPGDVLGKQMVMARRLVEAGVRFVEVSMGGWDTHQNGFTAIENNLNKLDPALGTLIEDLNSRGMLERTMVVCTGEFGRTPKINGNDGRDHYPRAWSGLIAGGGIKTGMVYGSTDAKGEEVKDNPCQIGDLHATICAALGVDYTHENQSPQGRPIKIVDKGKPIQALLA